MAIASLKPVIENKANVDVPKIEDKEYKSIVIDTKYTPLQSLLVFVGGSIWKCNYYSQVTNKSSDLRVQDPTQSPVYQQYNKIVNLEIKVESALSASQDDETKYMTVTGSGFINPFFVPEAGDVFIADVGNGNLATFVVNNTERKSYLKDSIFLIEYTLLSYLKDDDGRVADLENKVINTTYFSKDYALKGQNPFLTSVENEQINNLDLIKERLINYFFDSFYDYKLSTLIVPGQNAYTYDHYLTSFVLKLVDTFESDKIRLIRILNIDGDEVIKKPTIFTSLLKWDSNILKIAKRFMGLTYSSAFNRDPMLEGIAYSGVSLVVYPIVEYTKNNTTEPFDLYGSFMGFSYDNSYRAEPVPTGTEVGLPLSEEVLVNSLGVYGNTIIAGVNTPLVKPVTIDKSYVLSDSFYDNSDNKSLLEALVYQYLNSETISKDSLLSICNDYYNWSKLDQFYYIPILILLIKYSNRR